MTEYLVELPDEAATIAVGRRLALALPQSVLIYLEGDLGAGKTTLVRALLRALGHKGAVRSPTYTLIEPYELTGHDVFHLDLYRLGSPDELEDIGIRDILALPCVLLVEWPEKAGDRAWPSALRLSLDFAEGGARRLTAQVPPSWQSRWPPA